MIAYYFGCRDEAGHYVFEESGRRCSVYCGGWPEFLSKLDGVFLWPALREGYVVHAQFTYGVGNTVTVIGFNDYSVDSRPGSNSLFFFNQPLTAEEALAEAKRRFAWVFERLKFPVLTTATRRESDEPVGMAARAS